MTNVYDPDAMLPTDDPKYHGATGLTPAISGDPAPVGLPVEPVRGGWGAWPDSDDVDAEYTTPSTGDLQVATVPLIGAIAFGGVIMAAERVQVSSTSAGGVPISVVVGSRGQPRPEATCMVFHTTEVIGSFELLTDGQQDQLTPGFALPIGVAGAAGQLPPLTLPLRRATVRGLTAGPLTLYVLTIGYPTLQ
jgi:hypothetical protein